MLEGSAVVGVLTRSDILTALSGQGKDVLVTGIMRREIQTVDVNEMLEPAFQAKTAVTATPCGHVARSSGRPAHI